MGRRPHSPAQEVAILNALRVGNTRRASAAAAGVSHETFYRWLANVTFCDEVIKAEADAELRFLGQVATAAKTSWQAAAWWLERSRPDQYGRRTNLAGASGGAIEVKSDDEERQDRLRALVEQALEDARNR